MKIENIYSVTVARANEGLHQAEEFTVEAHTVTFAPNGSLTIVGTGTSRTLSPSTYRHATITRLLPEGY
jgi:hypothetical protein